jgi:hypothetical protein
VKHRQVADVDERDTAIDSPRQDRPVGRIP